MEDEKQVSNSEILAAINAMESRLVTKEVFDETIGGIKSQINDIKSQMVTKDIFEDTVNDLSDSISFIAQNAATKVEIKSEMNAMESRIVTKMAEHFNALKGEWFVAPINGLNEKSDLTVVKLENKKVFSKNDREEVTNIPVFAR